MSQGSNPQKVEEWTSRLARLAASNESIAVFCGNECVSEASLYYWKKKLRNIHDEKSASRRFQAVHVVPPLAVAARAETVIDLGHGVHVQLGSDLRVADLVVKQLLAATLETNSVTDRPGAKSC